MKPIKHLSRVPADVMRASGGSVAMESHSIAMEGFGDSVKNAFQTLKEKIAPSDHTKIVNGLAKLATMRKAAQDMKSKVSQANKDAEVTKSVGHMLKRMPITASNANDLVRGLATWRKKIENFGRRAAQAKDGAEVKKLRQELAVEMSKKGEIAKDLTLNRQDILRVLDELIALGHTADEVGKEYLAAVEKNKAEGGSAGLESLRERVVAMESIDDTLDIALEGVAGWFAGVIILFASIIAFIFGVFALWFGVAMFLCLQFVQAAGLTLGGIGLMWLGELGLSAADSLMQ